MKKPTRTHLKALSIAVMCCERFPDLYTKEHIENLKKEYSEKLNIYKSFTHKQK